MARIKNYLGQSVSVRRGNFLALHVAILVAAVLNALFETPAVFSL